MSIKSDEIDKIPIYFKYLKQKTLDKKDILFFFVFFGAVILLIISCLFLPNMFSTSEIWYFSLNLTVEAWWLLVALSMISVVIGYTLFFWGIEKISVITVSIIGLIEPIFAILLSVLLFGQEITPIALIGGAIVLVTSVLISME